MFGQGLEFGGISSADVGFTTWSGNTQLSGLGSAVSNQHGLTKSGSYYILLNYTDAYIYTLSGSTFSSTGSSTSTGLYIGTGACLTDSNVFYIKGKEPAWPSTARWKTASWSGSSLGSFSTVSGPSHIYGDLAFADVDGTGGYIYQVLANAAPNTTVRKYDPSNLNSYTDITLASPLNNSSNSTTNTLFWDGVGWWVVYMNGSITWAAVKFSPDFQTQTVTEQSLGSYGGYQQGYELKSSTFDGSNTVYLKAQGTDKAQKFTLS